MFVQGKTAGNIKGVEGCQLKITDLYNNLQLLKRSDYKIPSCLTTEI